MSVPETHASVNRTPVIYYIVCEFVNKTELELSAERLTVRTGPVPVPFWVYNQAIDVLASHSFYVRRRSRRGATWYQVKLAGTNMEEETVLASLPENHADYICGVLQTYYRDLPRVQGQTGKI